MSSHTHQHSCTCPHENLHYCILCKVVHCLDCNQEWGPKYTYSGWTTTVHQFPEGPRSSHGADEEGKASYIKSSKHAKHGHTDHGDRMPHPFGEEPPMSESGEGKGSK